MARTRFRRRLIAVAVLAAVAAGSLSVPTVGQEPPDGRPRIVVEAITLKHRPAAASLDRIYPLLSAQGTVELKPGENTLVLRDESGVVARIIPLLREFDQPPGRLRIHVQLVSAGTESQGQRPGPVLSPRVVKGLRELLRYESYTLLGRAEFETQEGLEAAYELSNDFRIAFRLGRLLEHRRVRLEDFRVSRKRAERPDMTSLIHTNLNLDLDKPMVLGLTPSEASDRALMVIVECHEGDVSLTGR